MDEKRWAAVLAAILLAIGGAWYYLTQNPPPPPAEEPPAEAVVEPPPPPPPPDYPVPPSKPDAPTLPALADSDAGIGSALAELIGKGSFDAFLIPDMLIRRIVVTIDNLPRDHVAPRLRPLKPTPPPLLVRREGGRLLLDPANAERYATQVRLFTAIDASQLVALYFQWYPLFQRAYVDLGYPDRSFNNRLVEVIDNLLATPQPPAEIELVQPKVAYEFADPQLEALTVGQKIVFRLDADQRARVMKQLSEIRAAVIGQKQGKP